jgi:putative ABC transport system permease protein
MYEIPVSLMPVHLDLTALSISLALITTISAALTASLHELRAGPAALMQPRAPKPGKRILLEYIRPLWQWLSFSRKVTARNIFRYKKRLLMTVIGFAGYRLGFARFDRRDHRQAVRRDFPVRCPGCPGSGF